MRILITVFLLYLTTLPEILLGEVEKRGIVGFIGKLKNLEPEVGLNVQYDPRAHLYAEFLNSSFVNRSVEELKNENDDDVRPTPFRPSGGIIELMMRKTTEDPNELKFQAFLRELNENMTKTAKIDTKNITDSLENSNKNITDSLENSNSTVKPHLSMVLDAEYRRRGKADHQVDNMTVTERQDNESENDTSNDTLSYGSPAYSNRRRTLGNYPFRQLIQATLRPYPIQQTVRQIPSHQTTETVLGHFHQTIQATARPYPFQQTVRQIPSHQTTETVLGHFHQTIQATARPYPFQQTVRQFLLHQTTETGLGPLSLQKIKETSLKPYPFNQTKGSAKKTFPIQEIKDKTVREFPHQQTKMTTVGEIPLLQTTGAAHGVFPSEETKETTPGQSYFQTSVYSQQTSVDEKNIVDQYVIVEEHPKTRYNEMPYKCPYNAMPHRCPYNELADILPQKKITF